MKQHHGFSLLELSIVLVIIGLIAGGIVAGSSMIRAAELRAVITEYQQYQTAMMTFRDKYLGLPGDLRNATAFWGQATNCGGSNNGQTLTGGTCDGNADGNNTAYRERFYAWHHLANAELIAGNYSGISGSGHIYADANAGENVPLSKLGSNAGWCFGSSGYGGGWIFDLNYSHMLVVGGTSGTVTAPGDCQSINYPMIPEEAWNIDKKIDDGMPAQGKVIASQITQCTDAWTTVDAYDAEYSLSGIYSDAYQCGLFFRQAY